MATLNLRRLLCVETEDAGKDEVYLVVNGEKIWGERKIGVGQGLSVNRQVNFTNSVEITLFDADAPDSDDYLGTIIVTNAMKGKGELTGYFLRDGADYTLYYDVV
jgi:hypothetical protein